jgi:hypothetical protein
MTAGRPNDVLQAKAEFVASGLDFQAQALTLLLAEMRALSVVLPGATHPAVARIETDAEIEADFDNMPV